MEAGVLAVAQSGGPSPVINASLAGIIREAQQHTCFTHIYGLIHGIEGALNEAMVDLSTESLAQLERLAGTPAAALGSSRYKLTDSDYERIRTVFRAHNIRSFVYIGGDGSMYVTRRLAEMMPELRVMGVPKTIDNDLNGTDHAPGYGSAARFLALATRDTGRDLEAMATFDDVTILEAMGRDAGWLAATSSLLKMDDDEAPHLIYVPEITFDEDRFLGDVARIHARLGRVFVVVGEGIRDAKGHFVGQRETYARDTMNRLVYSLTTGAASYLAGQIRKQLKLQARTLRPGLIGRALTACVSEVDRDEAERAGTAAIQHLAAGGSGVMVTLERSINAPYHCDTGLISLEQIPAGTKTLPRHFMNTDGTMTTDAFRDYALPLLGELPPPLARLNSPCITSLLPEYDRLF